MKKTMLVGLSLLLLTAAPGFAQDPESAIKGALEALKGKDTDRAITLLAEAIMMIQNDQPLAVREVVLCSEIRDFRDYESRSGAIPTGEPLLLYIEPQGYRINKQDDRYEIWVSEDAAIKNEAGDVIFEKKDWVVFRKAFDTPMIPFYFRNRVTDIPPGSYTFIFTLKDHNQQSFITESFKFTVK